MVRYFVAASIGLLALSACGGFYGNRSQLVTRAAFDFGCPESELELTPIDKRSQGVAGCGNRAVYIEQCKPCANG